MIWQAGAGQLMAGVLSGLKRGRVPIVWKGIYGLVVALVFLIPLPAMAIPQPGHYFYGDVTREGSPVEEATLITAKVSGTDLEYSTIVDLDGHYGYSPSCLCVPADDSGTPERDGGRPGESIEFYVNGHRAWLYDVAAEAWHWTYPFESGGTTQLQLEMLAPHRLFAPVVMLERR